MPDIDTFRQETRDWLEVNCPQSMRNLSFHWEDAQQVSVSVDAKRSLFLWTQRNPRYFQKTLFIFSFVFYFCLARTLEQAQW